MTILASASWAATYYASPDGASDASCLSASTAGSLDRAVALATASGDVIQLAAGTYERTSPITLQCEGVVFRGASNDASSTVIKGPGSGTSFTAFVVTKKATIENVTITGFYSTRGGTAVGGANSNWTQASNVTGINCIIADNNSAASAVYGGVWTNCVFSCNTNSTGDGGAGYYGTYYDCFFTNNMAKYSGGALFKTTVYSSRFIGNVSSSKGGGIYGGTAYDCDFIANRSPLGGAGCAITSDTSAYYNCRFFNNVSTRTDEGGGAIKGEKTSSLIASNCLFVGNSSGYSGGAGAGGVYHDCMFSNNTSKTYAGGVFRGTAYNCHFVTNTSGTGGAVEGGTYRKCSFVSNTARIGGAVASTSTESSFYDCCFTNNYSSATDNGGGAISGGKVTASNCVFVSNRTMHVGGASCWGTFRDCFFSNNWAKTYGGALYRATAINCVFITNSCSGIGGAVEGGISRNCGFFRNYATRGGAASANSADGKAYDCEFRHNRSTGTIDGGGAVWASSATRYVSSNCVFISNSSYQSGGASKNGSYYDCFFVSNKTERGEWGGGMCGGTAERCFFTGNTARYGGGCYNVSATGCVFSNNITRTDAETYGVAIRNGTAKNCLIVDNVASHSSGTVVEGATCINCTIVDNETKKYTVTGGMTKNCIVIGNSSDLHNGTHSNTLYNVSSSGTRVNCIQRTDAKFNAGRDPSLPYYYLRQGSPARNAGIDVGWTAESLDLRGEKRLVGAVDLGCYEYQPIGFSLFLR